MPRNNQQAPVERGNERGIGHRSGPDSKKMDVAPKKSGILMAARRRESKGRNGWERVADNSAHNHTMVFRAVRSINVDEDVLATQPLGEQDAGANAPVLVCHAHSNTESADLKSATPGIARDVNLPGESSRYDLKQMVLVFQRLAARALGAQGVRCEFRVEPDPAPIHISRKKGHGISLMFKETLSYTTHHIRCAAVSLRISVSREQLEVEIREDECGLFACMSGRSGGRDGDLLRRMQARIVEAAGTLQLATTPAGGSLVTLTVPLGNLI